MQSLYIAMALLLLLGLWGVLESGRKFRREFARRGKAWDAVCAALEQGQGLLIVDTIWGPQRGLGHPVIWFIPSLEKGDDLAAYIEPDDGGALLVRCPRSLKNLQALKTRFGQERVMEHSWAMSR